MALRVVTLLLACLLNAESVSQGCLSGSCSHAAAETDVDVTESREADALNFALLQTSQRFGQAEPERVLIQQKPAQSLYDELDLPPVCRELLEDHEHNPSITEEMISRSFNFEDLITSRNGASNCRLAPLSERGCKCIAKECDRDREVLQSTYEPDDVVCLSPARTGSETVSSTLIAAGQPAFHNHDCVLDDLLNNGAQRIVVSIRHPVARFVSGWQRYQTAQPEVEEHLGRIDVLIESIRNVSHPEHETALRWAYGNFGMAFLVPIVEYYLGGKVDVDRNMVKFVCTCNLDDDIATAVSDWNLALPEQEQDEAWLYANHTSNFSSDSYETWVSFLSKQNLEWIENIYKEDVLFYNQECQGHCEN